MRLSVVLLLSAAAGVVGGAWLIGMWCVGLAVIVDSAALAGYALFRDDVQPRVERVAGVTEEQRFISQAVERQRSA